MHAKKLGKKKGSIEVYQWRVKFIWKIKWYRHATIQLVEEHIHCLVYINKINANN